MVHAVETRLQRDLTSWIHPEISASRGNLDPRVAVSEVMSGTVSRRHRPVARRAPQQVTLFDLVGAIRDVTDNDPEVVAVVEQLLRSGSVRLRRDCRTTVRQAKADPSARIG